MKKKIISLILIGICGLELIGCEEPKDNVNINTETTSKNRFIDTGDVYVIEDLKFHVYYDKITDIVYLAKGSSLGNGSVSALSVLYNSNGQPIKLDEYNSTK